ncbi:uncharacterized protein LOC129957092 [Argiope bruennichi]|uniref:Uncharacterized protein n=1 Tax=Argiope bruennichi TaxID=94029 RepID=A0A8T0FIU9_ARGBR|nr:uncharacterized protein LOC129957092 [Argiope bruennichi]KAF8789459.1 hypothetical protein HNY73_007396 [Argiope bruennichi]
MEKQLRFMLKLSLQQMALRRVVVNLCNETDVLTLIENLRPKWFLHHELEEVIGPTVEAVKDKVSKLELLESLKKRMGHLIRPVVLDILDWKTCHEKFLNKSNEHLDVSILELLCWTSAGAIDYQKTAANLALLEALDIAKRYKLACLYCLVDYIPILWVKLPEEIKEEYTRGPMVNRDTQLDYYWAYFLKEKESEIDDVNSSYLKEISFNHDAFKFSALEGNTAATKYFFQKISKEMKISFLYRTVHFVIANRCRNPIRKTFPDKNVSEVFCYLLDLLRPEHQIQVLKDRPYQVMRCFLDWPLQDFFLDVTDLIWTCFPQNKYRHLLLKFTSIIKYPSYYFPDLVQKFFLRSPSSFKKLFISESGSFITEFSCAEDSEGLEVIFKNVDLGDRSELVSSDWFLQFLEDLITRDKWHLAELCVRETSLSKENKKNLKRALVRFYPEIGMLCNRRECKGFFEFLDQTDASELLE